MFASTRRESKACEKDVPQVGRLKDGNFSLPIRDEKTPQDRHLALDRRYVEIQLLALHQFTLRLLCQRANVMLENPIPM